MNLFHAIGNYVVGLADKIEPWLKTLLHEVKHDVVAALVPLAHEAAAEILNEGGQLLNGASLQSVAANAGALLMRTAMKAEQAAIQATGHDLLAAGTAALAALNAAGVPNPSPRQGDSTQAAPVAQVAPAA